MLFDSHAHLNEDGFSEEERKELAAGVETSGLLSYVADIGYDLPSSEQAVRDAETYPWCVAVVGVHPHDSGSMTEEIYTGIRELARGPSGRFTASKPDSRQILALSTVEVKSYPCGGTTSTV